MMRSILCLTMLAGLAFRVPLADAAQEDATSSERHAELEAFVERYLDAFNSQDADGIRSVCSAREAFAWFEDGELRYPSVDRILEVIAAMPPGMRFETRLEGRELRLVSDEVATLATGFVTTASGPATFSFEGSMTLVLERESDGWRILLGHTSTKRDAR